MCVAQPWPLPSAQDLLDALQQFSYQSPSTDPDGVHSRLLLNREQFMAADVWLTRQQPPHQQGEGEGKGVDRYWNIKQVSRVSMQCTCL